MWLDWMVRRIDVSHVKSRVEREVKDGWFVVCGVRFVVVYVCLKILLSDRSGYRIPTALTGYIN